MQTDVGLRATRDTDRKERRRRDRPENRHQHTAAGNNCCKGCADGDALAARESQRAQGRVILAHQRELAAQDDADRDRSRQGRHSRGDPERQREDVDRVARTLDLDREAPRVEQ